MIVKRNKTFSIKKNIAIGVGAIGLGGALLAKTKKGHLTGKVTRYHDTETKNVGNILREGIKSKHSMDPGNITNTTLKDVALDKKKDLVYTSKTKRGAFNIGETRAGEDIPNPDLRLKDRLNLLRGKSKNPEAGI